MKLDNGVETGRLVHVLQWYSVNLETDFEMDSLLSEQPVERVQCIGPIIIICYRTKIEKLTFNNCKFLSSARPLAKRMS